MIRELFEHRRAARGAAAMKKESRLPPLLLKALDLAFHLDTIIPLFLVILIHIVQSWTFLMESIFVPFLVNIIDVDGQPAYILVWPVFHARDK